MILGKDRRRTNLHGNANAVVQETHGGAIGSGPIGGAPIGGTASRLVVKIDQNYIDVVGCVVATFSLWRELFSENSW
jgi:hypothetical protein